MNIVADHMLIKEVFLFLFIMVSYFYILENVTLMHKRIQEPSFRNSCHFYYWQCLFFLQFISLALFLELLIVQDMTDRVFELKERDNHII